MNVDRLILIGIIVISVCLLKLIPTGKAREAWILFLSMQMITWPAGLIPVEAGWLYYPVQLLPHANHYNKTSFTYEFLLLPILAILFSLYFPKKGNGFVKLIFYTFFTGVFTIIEVILEKTTNLIEYQGWRWYWTLITLMISFYINHQYFLWIRKKLNKVETT